MKYTMVSRGDDYSHRVQEQLNSKLLSIGLERDDVNPELVITVGGDGTMLKAVHAYLNRIDEVVLVGVHTGKLGFYTDFIHDELHSLIDKIEKGVYTDVLFPLLSCHVCKKDKCEDFYALNEISIINPYRTLHIDVFINEELFESFQGTGICISTPSGSSAYNKSLGGALLHPSLKAFQMTEIGSINNNVYRTIGSPMIFPKEHNIMIKSTDFNKVTLTIDHEHMSLDNYEKIIINLSDKAVHIRQYRENDFWKRVQKSFL